jgi:hypothetical protein
MYFAVLMSPLALSIDATNGILIFLVIEHLPVIDCSHRSAPDILTVAEQESIVVGRVTNEARGIDRKARPCLTRKEVLDFAIGRLRYLEH